MWNKGYRLNDQSFCTTLPRYYLRKMFSIVVSTFFFLLFCQIRNYQLMRFVEKFSMNYFREHVVRFPFSCCPFIFYKKKKESLNQSLLFFKRCLKFLHILFSRILSYLTSKKKIVRSTDRSVNGRQTDRFRVEANNRSYRIDVLYFCEIPVNRAIETASVDSLRSRCQSLNKR